MNIKDLNGLAIKKALRAQSASYRYHNKNKSGGNFGINIRGLKGADFEISGDYDTEGNVRQLRFGYLYQHGISIPEMSFDDLMLFITKAVLKIENKGTAITFAVKDLEVMP
jgi:hypothetical protein